MSKPRSQDRFVPYPKVADIMEFEFERTNETSKHVAGACKIATGTVGNLRLGLRPCSPDVANKLSRVFYPLPVGAGATDANAKGRQLFIKQILDASKERAPGGPTGNLLDDLADGLVKLHITSAECKPISGDSTCAMELLGTKILEHCGIPYRPIENRLNYTATSVSPTDIQLSAFDSPDRMLRLKFWRTPVRMSLGCIGLADERYLAKADKIAYALSAPDNKQVRPIVLANSVGLSHCRNRLRFDDAELVIVHLVPGSTTEEQLAARLLQEANSSRSDVPIVCVDELLAFKVLNALKGRGFPVFSMNSQRAVQETGPRRETPQYYFGIAIKRENGAFQEYLQDVLVQFLSTEIQTTAYLWFQLAQKLVNMIVGMPRFPQDLTSPEALWEAERWRRAWEWVKFTLHWDSLSIRSYTDPANLPWKPILHQARELMQRHFAADPKIIRNQVRLSLSNSERLGYPGGVEAGELQFLAELFDVKLESGCPTDEDGLVEELRQALLGKNKIMFEVRQINPLQASESEITAIKTLLANLRNMYGAMNEPLSVQRLDHDIDKLPEVYGGDRGKIFLASVRGKPNQVLGEACLVFCENTHGKKEGEVRFSWVDPAYRRQGIGNRLIEGAIQLARESQCESVFAEILPSLKAATSLATNQQFELAKERTPFLKGRVVFERRL